MYIAEEQQKILELHHLGDVRLIVIFIMTTYLSLLKSCFALA